MMQRTVPISGFSPLLIVQLRMQSTSARFHASIEGDFFCR